MQIFRFHMFFSLDFTTLTVFEAKKLIFVHFSKHYIPISDYQSIFVVLY